MSEDNVEVVRRAFGRGRVELAAWDPDVEMINAKGWVIESTYHGHEGVLRWWEDLEEAFEDFRIELDDVIPVDAERVVTTQRFVGRFRATGIPLDGAWASVLRIRDGRIIRAEGHMSKARAMRAVGLWEARAEE
jgi:ketosteroid isomerase-like protein